MPLNLGCLMVVLLLVISVLVIGGVSPSHLMQHASLHIEAFARLLGVGDMGLLVVQLMLIRIEVLVTLPHRGCSDRAVLRRMVH